MGEGYCLVTIAEPISFPVIDGVIKNFNNPKYDLFMFSEKKRTGQGTVSLGRKLKNYSE